MTGAATGTRLPQAQERKTVSPTRAGRGAWHRGPQPPGTSPATPWSQPPGLWNLETTHSDPGGPVRGVLLQQPERLTRQSPIARPTVTSFLSQGCASDAGCRGTPLNLSSPWAPGLPSSSGHLTWRAHTAPALGRGLPDPLSLI